MFRRLRQLRVSLAVKCQILFGAAVALIIGAALAVPWQRMEQLTEQINERTARTLCDDAIADHLAGIKANVRHASAATTATTMPGAGMAEAAALAGGRTSTAVPHLALLASPGAGASLNPFEKRALTH